MQTRIPGISAVVLTTSLLFAGQSHAGDCDADNITAAIDSALKSDNPGTISVGNSCDMDGKGQTILGSPGNDVLIGTPCDDIIIGDGGNDLICGKRGNDVILDGLGHNSIGGGHGKDIIIDLPLLDGGAFDAEPSESTVRGGKGSDLIVVTGNSTAYGGRGADVLLEVLSEDGAELHGGRGRDFLAGSPLTGYNGGRGNKDICFASDQISTSLGSDQTSDEATETWTRNCECLDLPTSISDPLSDPVESLVLTYEGGNCSGSQFDRLAQHIIGLFDSDFRTRLSEATNNGNFVIGTLTSDGNTVSLGDSGDTSSETFSIDSMTVEPLMTIDPPTEFELTPLVDEMPAMQQQLEIIDITEIPEIQVINAGSVYFTDSGASQFQAGATDMNQFAIDTQPAIYAVQPLDFQPLVHEPITVEENQIYQIQAQPSSASFQLQAAE